MAATNKRTRPAKRAADSPYGLRTYLPALCQKDAMATPSRRNSTAMSFLLSIAMFGFFLPSNSTFADDSPKAGCAQLSTRVKSFPAKDLSRLNDRQQKNTQHFIKLQTAGGSAPNLIWLLDGSHPYFPKSFVFSLFFPGGLGRCPAGCNGTAVLPDGPGFDIQRFSYRYNYVAEPRLKIEMNPENAAPVIFMAEDRKRLIAFHSVDASKAQSTFLEDKHLAGLTSPQSSLLDSPRSLTEKYLACLNNIFHVDDRIDNFRD